MEEKILDILWKVILPLPNIQDMLALHTFNIVECEKQRWNLAAIVISLLPAKTRLLSYYVENSFVGGRRKLRSREIKKTGKYVA